MNITSALLIAVAMAFSGEASGHEPAAVKAGEAWLALVDSARYAESWDSASSTFKKAVTQQAWVKNVSEARALVGKFETRKLSVAQPVKDPPNAPAGDYFILQYTSNFANKNEAAETVVLSKDAAQQWRTAGYFVK